MGFCRPRGPERPSFERLDSSSDRLFLPSTLVLDRCGIQKAGDASYIAAFCAHVVGLDLSHNQLSDWDEVGHLWILSLRPLS